MNIGRFEKRLTRQQRNNSFLHFVRRSVVILAALLAGFFILYDAFRSFEGFRSRAEGMREDYIQRQKQLIRREVVQVVDMMAAEKAMVESRARELIRSRVKEAHAVALNIHREWQNRLPEEQLQKLIRDALRPIRFANDTGYFFATRMDGVEMLFADHPELEGTSLRDVRDTEGRYVIREMIALVQSRGEGFYEYLWTKPGMSGNRFRKISFIKKMEPCDWLIGAGVYIDDILLEVQKELLVRTSRIRFGTEGYIFINKMDGTAMVSNGRVFGEEQKLWEVFPEKAGKNREVFLKEYQAARQKGGAYINYTWQRLTRPEMESPKVSFIQGFPDFGWIVGAGVYLDDVEADIAVLKQELLQQARNRALLNLIVFSLVMLLLYLIFLRLNRSIRSDFDVFVSFLGEVARSDRKIEIEALRFDEFRLLAQDANRMLADKLKAQEEKERMEREVLRNRKLESIGILAGGIAHDFNNILTGLFGNMELAKMELEEDHPAFPFISNANSALERAKGLTGQLLTFSKGGEPILDSMDVASLCREVVNFNLAGSPVGAVFDIPQGLWHVRADRGQISQVISNITVNAQQAMPNGGILHVGMANVTDRQEYRSLLGEDGSEQEGFVRLTMRDEGEGIAPELLDRIFDPFFTTKPLGSGLGLSTVHSIVRKHGGFVRAESEPGRGSTFTVYLPAEREVVVPGAKEGVGVPDGYTPRYRILVMDDEDMVRGVTARMLGLLGHECTFALDGRQAVALYRDALSEGNPFHLLIMDLTVPGGMGGVEALRRIRELDPRVRAIVASGYSNEKVVADYLDYGFVGRLAKPFQLAELRDEVKRVGALSPEG